MQVTVFMQDQYLAHFVHSTFDALPSEKVKGAALIPLEIEHIDIARSFFKQSIEFGV